MQAGLIYSVILFGGTTSQLKANAYDILSEKVISRKNDLENEMIQRWSNVHGPMQTILDRIDAVLTGQWDRPRVPRRQRRYHQRSAP